MVGAMTNVRIGYRPAAGDGAWWLAADGDAVVLLSPAVSTATAAGVWRGLGRGGIGAVLEALTSAFGTSLTAIPPFALAIAEAGGVRVAVRGDIEIVVEGESAEAVSGAGVATWTERFLPGAIRATVAPGAGALPPAADAPLRSGVVRTDLVELELAASPAPVRLEKAAPLASAPTAPTASTAPAPAAPAASAPTDSAQMADAEEQPAAVASSASAISSASAAPAASAAPSASAAPAASVIDSVPPGLLTGRGAASPPAPIAAPEPDDTAEPAAAAVSGGAEASAAPTAPPTADSSADTLIPEATAAEDADPAPVDEYDLLWGETVARPVSAAAIVAADPDAEAEAKDEPAAAPSSPERPSAGSDDLGDHDGATIAVAEMRALRAERPAFDSTDSVPARRPAQGRIRLSTGRVVELERPVIIGRRPKSTRTTGADLPTLVAVDSPEQDISRSHVEIRAEGEHVLVTDLDTTNGTVLLRGGNEPVRLHPNEPTMVVTGDVLDLGDDVTVTFEDLS